MAFLKKVNFDHFFEPKTVAVIGASRSVEKIGNQLVINLMSNPKIHIFPVNPNADTIYNIKCYMSVNKIPVAVDLAIIALPAASVEEAVLECAKKDIKNCIIISAGFSENKGEGVEREKRLISIAEKYAMGIVGPNCLGIISPNHNVNASFGSMGPRGNVTFISQSGALGTAILDWAKKRNIGFSNFISLGNKAIISEIDFLRYFESKKNKDVIALYVESIEDGQKFLDIAKKISKKNKIIVLKGGQEIETQSAVTSHTGAMAGSFTAFKAALKQSNCIEANNLEEFFSLIKILSTSKTLGGNKIVLLTNGGGPGILTLDMLLQTKNLVADISSQTKKKLQSILPSEASCINPIDILGDATPKRYREVLEILMQDSGSDIVYVLLTPQEVTDVEKIAQAIVDVQLKYDKLIIASFFGGLLIDKGKNILRQNGIMHFQFPEQALKVLQKINKYEKKKSRRVKTKKILKLTGRNQDIKKQLHDNKSKLSESEAYLICDKYRLPHPRTEEIQDIHELRIKLSSMKFPVALKLDSPSIFHRTKEKAIYLNLETIRQAEVAFNKLKKMNGEIYCQEMVEKGIEIIIGAKSDHDFRHLIMFGSGGIYTEYLQDVSFGITPISKYDAYDLIEETKVGKFIPKYRNKIAEIMCKISLILQKNPSISELDINPLIINKKGVCIVDIKIQLSSEV